MDVKLSARFFITSGCLLATMLGAPAWAEDDASSMVVVTASDGEDDVQYATDDADEEPAEPSDLVIHVADDATDQPEAPAEMASDDASADMAFVSASDAAAAPAAIVEEAPAAMPAAMIVDADVVPAVHGQQGRAPNFSWDGVFSSGPRRPSASAGIQGPQRGSQYESVAVVGARPAMQREQQTLNDAPPAYDAGAALPSPSEFPTVIAPRPAAAAMASVATASPASSALQQLRSPVDHAQAQLINAYQLSLTACTEAEYSQIVQWCSNASRVELDAETRKFTDNLSAWALNRRGQARADEGQIDLALADFHAALEISPSNWRAMHNRAVTFAQRGEFAESFDDLCRVIQVNPKFAKAYANRATLYVQAGDLERAVGDYDAALAADGELLAALVGRGRVCHLLGRLDDALASLDSAVKVAPQDAEIVCSRADLLADVGRYEDALLDYAQAIDLNKKFEHAYRNGAWLLATCPEDSIRDVEGALAGAQAALDCGYGERHAALDTMAAALANAGRFDEAVGTLQQAIEIAPENVQAAYEARQQLYEAGQPFRTQPVGVEPVGAESVADEEPADDAQSAVFIEE